MNTTKTVQEICQDALQAVLADPDHDLKPLHRLTLYRELNLDRDNYLNPGFLILQIITAYHVLPIWQADQSDNDLPQTLLKIAEQVLQHPETRLEYADQLHEFWVDLDIADADGTYTSPVLEAACSAFEAARIALHGFDEWVEWELEETDGSENTYVRGSDSARHAATALSGWMADPMPGDEEKRRQFWEWWLTEAIPQALTLALDY